MKSAHDYVCLGELRKETVPFEVYERKTFSFAGKLGSSLRWISKKAFFITSVPFYWFILFRYVVNWFDMGFFIFVVCASIAMSFFGSGWGIINSMAR